MLSIRKYTNFQVSCYLVADQVYSVNLAAACILTSVEHARELGISADKFIYPLGGAGTSDSLECETPASILHDLANTITHSLAKTSVLVEP